MKVKIKLKEATREDFLEVKGYNQEKKRIWGLIEGVPYWLIDSKGNLENKNYITTQATDLKDLGVFLKQKRIFIPK